MAPPTVLFRVETEYELDEDEYFVIAVLGSIKALGEWDSSRAVLAKKDPCRKGKWVVEVALPVNVTFQWKWLITNKQRSHVYQWETRFNRVFATEWIPREGMLRAPWDGELETVSDTTTGTSEISVEPSPSWMSRWYYRRLSADGNATQQPAYTDVTQYKAADSDAVELVSRPSWYQRWSPFTQKTNHQPGDPSGDSSKHDDGDVNPTTSWAGRWLFFHVSPGHTDPSNVAGPSNKSNANKCQPRRSDSSWFSFMSRAKAESRELEGLVIGREHAAKQNGSMFGFLRRPNVPVNQVRITELDSEDSSTSPAITYNEYDDKEKKDAQKNASFIDSVEPYFHNPEGIYCVIL